jgi:phage FluMu protein Com
MARKHRFRFGFPDVFAGRLHEPQGQRWLPANSILLRSLQSAHSAACCLRCRTLRDSLRAIEQRDRSMRPSRRLKNPRPVSRRGLNSCDGEHMQVICPTCQSLNARRWMSNPGSVAVRLIQVANIFVENRKPRAPGVDRPGRAIKGTHVHISAKHSWKYVSEFR